LQPIGLGYAFFLVVFYVAFSEQLANQAIIFQIAYFFSNAVLNGMEIKKLLALGFKVSF
jgi:hypothetical protein